MAVYFYHRATGLPLPGERGSPEFLAAYAAAENTRIRKTGTISEWIRRFEGTPEQPNPVYDDFEASTKAEYRRKLKIIDAKWGRLPIELTQAKGFRRDVLDWRDKRAKNGKREADNLVGALARVLVYAVDRGEIANNPLAKIERLYSADRAEKIWLPEHVAAFTKVASVEMCQAMILALHTGQRQGDLLRLSWSAYDGQRITLRQRKTGKLISVRCTAALKKMLDGMPRRATVILTTKTGRAFKKRYFSEQWKAACVAAEIDDLHFHDTRGTAVTMLAEAGCTVPEIASVTGHSLQGAQRILDTYLARTVALSDAAIFKLEAHAKRLQRRQKAK